MRAMASARSVPATTTLPSIGSYAVDTSCPRSRSVSTRAASGHDDVEHVTRLRQEAGVGVLGVHPHLDRVPGRGDLVLGQRQVLAGGDGKLPLHEVETGDLLGDAVLDLEAGVHLQEVRLTVSDEELDRAGAGVADLLAEGDRRLVQRGPQLVGEPERRCLLDDLLVAALRRAVALEQVHDVAGVVAEHLHLDVAARLDVLLDQHGVVTERRGGLTLGRFERCRVVLGVGDDPHALAATTGRGLDEHGVGVGGHRVGVELRGDRYAGLLGDGASPVLAAHRVHDLGGRADEHETGIDDGAGELGALRQEAVARVDRLGARLLGGGEQPIDVEVGLRRRGRPEVHGVVGEAYVRRIGVSIGVDRDAAQTRLTAGEDDPASNLATVGHE